MRLDGIVVGMRWILPLAICLFLLGPSFSVYPEQQTPPLGCVYYP